MKNFDRAFWGEMTHLASTNHIVVDRPKGQPHPRCPEMVYPLDYGYLEGTSASDGGGMDVRPGSLDSKTLTGILCTFDRLKHDAEIKLLLGCSAQDVDTILKFHNPSMKILHIPNPEAP